MVGRVLRGPEHEQQKGQDEGQRFDVLYARPVHCQHAPTLALMVALLSGCRAPTDGYRCADVA